MSHSKFFSSVLLLILLNLVIKPLWIFGIDRQVQNISGAASYGAYFALLNLSIVFNFLLDWGLSSFVNKELATEHNVIKDQLGSLVFLRLIFSVLYLLVVFTVAFITGVNDWMLLLSVAGIQFLTFLFVFFRSIVTAHQWFRTDAFLSVLDKTLMILFCGFIIYFPAVSGGITVHKFAWTQFICTAIAATIAFFLLVKNKISFGRPAIHFFNKELFLSLLPFALTVFVMSAHVRQDGFLLERLHPQGAEQAGIYATAYRLLDAANMPGYLIASFLLPFVSRLWSEKKSMNEVILQSRNFLLMFCIGVVCTGVLMAPWLQQLLYHRTDEYSVHVLQWCIISLLPYAVIILYGAILTATGFIWSYFKMNCVAVILNLTLNLILIPRFGALGCCYAAFTSQALLAITVFIFVNKKIALNTGIKSLLVYVITAVLVCGCIYQLQKIQLQPFYIVAITAILVIIIMVITKMISVNTWLSFVKNK